MSNKTGAALIDTVRARSARSNDSVLITETFVLDQLNEGQIQIVRKVPRQIDLDSSDITTYQVSSAKTVAISGATRSSNVVTVTTSAAHCYLATQEISLEDVDSGSETNAFSGVHTIASVPSTTTYTFAQTGANESNLAAGTSNAYSFPIGTLNPAHIGNIWIQNGSSTRQAGLKYRPLKEFRNKYEPVSEESASEPVEYTRQGNKIYFNCPVASDYNALYLRIDYTAWATDLANDTTASELSDSNEGLILFALSRVYDQIALAQPMFESKALKTRVLFNNWLDEYIDFNELRLEELY